MPFPKGKSASGNRLVTDEEFIADFPKIGAAGLMHKYGLAESSKVYQRRRAIEERYGIVLTSPTKGGHVQQLDKHPAAVNLGIHDGHVLIGSDSHYLPGVVTAAHRAFVEFAREYKPKVIIKNGDELDFPTISRFAHGWETRPTVAEEIEYTNAMLGEIEKVAPNAELVWPVGNHDSRLETRIATAAPELAKLKGVHLKDHFNERWKPCMACFINKDVVVKHRIKGGIHATRNNTLNAGRTVITGHLHSLKVSPLSDYNGTRWGVDCGTMADPYGPQFSGYTELSPLDWRSGFVLLTFKAGRLLWPETIWVSGADEVQFRGNVLRV